MTIPHLAAKSLHDFFRPFAKVLKKPDQKKCFSMLKGMIEGETVQLSGIGRKVSGNTKPKTYCEKVGKSLEDLKKLSQIQLSKGQQLEIELIIFDETDCQRKYAKKIHGIIKVRDGSTGDTSGRGYGLHGITVKTKRGEYVPLLLRRYAEQNRSAEEVMFEVMNIISPDHGGVWVMDRGFDDRKVFDLLLDRHQEFLIRVDRRGSQRLLEIFEEKEKHLVSTLTAHMGKIGYRRVRLPGRKETLTLIHYHKNPYREPLALLTTLTPKTEKQALRMAKQYLKRWKIEDYFRFVKTKLNLEKIMLQIPERIDGLLALILIASAFIMKLEQREKDYAFEIHYRQWLKKNQVSSSWSSLSRFLKTLFQEWHLTFRITHSPPNSLQLALLPL